MATAAAGFLPFPIKQYTVAGASVSLAEMLMLLGVHPTFNLLAEADGVMALPEKQIVVPEKHLIFWDLLGLWIELNWPQEIHKYLESLGEAAADYYRRSEALSQLNPFEQGPRPDVLVAVTLANFDQRVSGRLGNLRELAIAISRQGDRFVEHLADQDLLLDPSSFRAKLAGAVLLVASLGLSRGSYFQLTQKGGYVRTEIVTGLMTYQREKGVLDPKQAAETKKLEWDLPEKTLDVLERAVRTHESTARTLLDPDKGPAQSPR